MQTPSLSLVSLNVEASRHLDRVIPFLNGRRPDVACLQEVMATDLPRLTRETGMQAVFASMRYLNVQDGPETPQLGLAILSKESPDSWEQLPYGDFHDVRFLDVHPNDPHTHTVLLTARFGPYCVSTTHFTWTSDGEANTEQSINLERLLALTMRNKEFVLCGDFNAPRGKEIFDALAGRLTDNVPASALTSIDGNLHRAGHLQLMVDGLFSTPGYAVDKVEVVDGVSDHCAIVGTVQALG